MHMLVLSILGLWFRRLDHRRLARFCFLLGTSWVCLCAIPQFSNWMRHNLEDNYPQQDASSYPVADAIVILGGDFKPNHIADIACRSDHFYSRRTAFGYALYGASRASFIFLSGGNDEARNMAQQLICKGVPTSSLTLENNSIDTRENATNTAPLLRHVGARRILLVTSPIHMSRASAAFRKLGIETIPAPAREQFSHRSVPQWHPITTLLRSGQALKEYGGLAYYRMRNWI